MMLEGKTILIMGIRNKWSIAWGAALAAQKQGATILFAYHPTEKKEKILELVDEIPGAKAYECDVADDENIQKLFREVEKDYGKIDGILHSIAHANTEDLRNDFIETSREGFAHANDISAYSFVAVARYARQILKENGSLVSLTYYGSQKVLQGYNVMGVAKAALEASVRYLSENLGKQTIRVNAVSAGPIKTLSAKGIKDFGGILDVVEQRAPLHRNVTTEEVGNVIAFLLSDMSRAITGQVIYADNGYNVMGM